MPYQVLARKYRPTRFADVVGQDHVTRTLLNALAQDRIAHGYIFSGHRGIGKTTIARILASALNCRNPIGSEARPTSEPCNACLSCLEIRQGNAVDMLEIDAATNRGIDEIRELRDAARYSPARDRFKIILLDEAHQITDAAFNALLKTLEEPPAHIVFMMATTQPEDIPQTIRSRCQHFSFHAVKLDDIVGQLARISEDENIIVDEATLGLLAEAGDGSMRDALSIMDQAIASAPSEEGRPILELDQVRELMGAVSNVVFEQMLAAVHNQDAAEMLSVLNRLLDAGNGPQAIARQLVRFLRNCTVAKITGLEPTADATGYAADLLQISTEERRRAARTASLFSEEELARFLSLTLRTFDDLGYKQEPRFHLELGLLKLVHAQRLQPLEQVLAQLGAVPPARLPQPKPAAERLTIPAETPVPRITRPTPTRSAALPSLSPANGPAYPEPTPTANESHRPIPAITQLARHPDSPASLSTHPDAPLSSSPANDSAQSPSASASGTIPLPAAFSDAPATQASRSIPAAAQSLAPPQTFPAPEPVRPTQTLSSEAPARPQTHPEPHPAVILNFSVGRTSTTSPTRGVAPMLDAPPDEDPSYLEALAASAPPDQPESVTETAIEPAAPTDQLQSAVLAALEAANQPDAAHQLEEAIWTLATDVLHIQTTLSEKMISFVLNPEAQRILRAAVRDHVGPAITVTLLPGTPASAKKAPKKRAPKSGSAADLAEKHPLVQEARRLFSADIANVIDLRNND